MRYSQEVTKCENVCYLANGTLMKYYVSLKHLTCKTVLPFSLGSYFSFVTDEVRQCRAPNPTTPPSPVVVFVA